MTTNSHSRPSKEIAVAVIQRAAEDRKRHSIWNSIFAPVLDLTLGNDNRVPHYDHVLVRSQSSMSLEHGRRDRVEILMEVAYWDSLYGVRS